MSLSLLLIIAAVDTSPSQMLTRYARAHNDDVAAKHCGKISGSVILFSPSLRTATPFALCLRA
jgi:hypothetical protein